MSTVEISSDNRLFMNGLFAFVDQEVVPIQQALGESFTNPRRYWREDGRLADAIVEARRQVRMASARAGYYTAFCPRELGGEGLGPRLYYDTFEELIYRTGPPNHQMPMYVLAHTSTGPTALWMHASDELKGEVLGPLSRGELQGSFAMSEPTAGSDAWGMKMTATKDGDEWVLNGQKQWASWSPTADFLITFAITDKELFTARRGGLTCFYVPTAAPGYRIDSILPILGELGGEEAILSFDDVRVPDKYRMGPVGDGFRIGMQGSAGLKTTKIARTTGFARWAHERAVEYSKTRYTFGKTLSEHQTIQNILAENAIELYTCRLMGKDIADKLERGYANRGEAAMADAFVFAATNRIIDRAMQVWAGMGMVNETHFYEGWQMTRVARLSEGPTEIQLRTVAKELITGRLRV